MSKIKDPINMVERNLGGVQELTKENKKLFIGVAWPYVNGDLHIGHLAGYLLPADICARYNRAIGKDVLMVSGSDCYGTPITVEADKRGITPREVVEIYHAKDAQLFKDVLGLTYDIYTKTDTEHHIKVVQDFFVELLNKGYIFVDTVKQYYSPEEHKFLPDRYVEGTCKDCGYNEARSDQCDNCGKLLEQSDLDNPRSKLSGKEVELKDTQHYFLDWPKLQPRIEEYVRRVGPTWKKWVYSETLGWLRKGLKPRAITRDIDWGVPLPVERIPQSMLLENMGHKRLYVWFEAVIGYLSASTLWSQETSGDWRDYWYNNDKSKHYYFMGKDNLVFHTIFWPGQLMVYDQNLHLPDIPSVNMFLDLEGRKFSKSKGVSISIEDIVEKFGNDTVRFYLTLIMPEIKDSSFSWKDFSRRNNELLVGNLGNFIHRTLSLLQNIGIDKVEKMELSEEVETRIQRAFYLAGEGIEGCEFKDYLEAILGLSGYGNKFIDYEKVWQLKKNNDPKFQEVAKQLYSLVLALGYLTLPLMPDTSGRIFSLLGVDRQLNWPKLECEVKELESLVGKIDSSIKPTPLFKKIDLDLIE